MITTEFKDPYDAYLNERAKHDPCSWEYLTDEEYARELEYQRAAYAKYMAEHPDEVDEVYTDEEINF